MQQPRSPQQGSIRVLGSKVSQCGIENFNCGDPGNALVQPRMDPARLCAGRTERCQKSVADTVEFAGSVDRSLHQPRIDRFTFKLITPVSRKEMHVQVWQRVSMNFVIQLHRTGRGRQCFGYLSCITHKCRGRCLGKIVQFDSVNLRHETHVASDSSRFLHRDPRSF